MKTLRTTTCFLLFLFISTFTLQAQIQKGLDVDGLAPSDWLGYDVSMPDENTFAAGAPQHNGTGYMKGQARVFKWDGVGWIQMGNSIDGVADEDQAGRAVFMPDANTLAVGAPDHDYPGVLAGQVRVYSWNGTAWTQKGADIYGNAPEAQAGEDVFMADANTIAVGAPGSINMYGQVSVYTWDGSSWVPKGFPITGEEMGDGFGRSVSMPDTNTLAVGAWLNGNHGHVRVFSWNGSTWIQRGTDIDGLTGAERFGASVSMPDVNNLGIGAYHHNGNGFGAGAVRTFSWNGNDWIQRGTEILGDSAEDFCGFSVSMPDADHLAIGNIESSAGPRPGRTKIYNWNGNDWSQIGNDIVGESNDDDAGYSVCMPDSNTVAIGAINNDGGGQSSGHVRVYGITSTTGQNKISHDSFFKIHPNPSSTIVEISLQADGADVNDVSIRDLSGRKLNVTCKSTNPLVIDVSSYDCGIYLLQLTTAKAIFSGKILVQRD